MFIANPYILYIQKKNLLKTENWTKFATVNVHLQTAMDFVLERTKSGWYISAKTHCFT